MQKKSLQRWIAFYLAFLMLITTMIPSSFSMVAKASDSSLVLLESSGWLESAYVKWVPMQDADGYVVYVKKEDYEEAASLIRK